MREMLPVKLVRSLVLGEPINNNPFLLHTQIHHDHNGDDDDLHSYDTDIDSDCDTPSSTTRPSNVHLRRTQIKNPHKRTPLLIFIPTKELITDTYQLATLARDIGMDLYPNPSLSHIIFSWPSSHSSSPSTSSSSSTSNSKSYPSLFSSSSSSWSLPNDAVPLPFPSLAVVSVAFLRCFVSLSRGFFKLVFLRSSENPIERIGRQGSNWDCCSSSLISRRTGCRIESMEGFSRALAGMGWTLFKTSENPNPNSGNGGTNSIYLFRKVDSSRVRTKHQQIGNGNGGEGCRMRELRLPPLDFRNAPLRILQYILLMTDDIFYLA